MSSIRCFVITQTDRAWLSLRRFTFGLTACPIHGSYHNAQTPIGEGTYLRDDRGHYSLPPEHDRIRYPRTDSRWPAQCACGYVFQDAHEWQVSSQHIYVTDEGAEYALHGPQKAPAGALYRAEWREEYCHGEDGQCWMCITPGGDWCIDDTASNCKRPGEPHQCWCRHGSAPDFHVDKVGNTCAAGAGSILCGSYHGYLHNGHLVEC